MSDLFLLVLAGHLLGDFIVQTDRQAATKESSWRADLVHVLTYHLTMAVLILPVWHDWRPAAFLSISIATHALVDRRWPTRLVLATTGSKGFSTVFWGVIATDQAPHRAPDAGERREVQEDQSAVLNDHRPGLGGRVDPHGVPPRTLTSSPETLPSITRTDEIVSLIRASASSSASSACALIRLGIRA